MKSKYVYYIAVIFIIVFAMNFIGAIGLNIWGLSNIFENNEVNNANEIPYDQWIAQQQYTQYYSPKIDSLIEVNPQAAISYIDTLITIYPNEYFLDLKKGIAYYKIDSFESAHKQFQKSMEKKGWEFPGAQGYSGWALAKLEKYDQAIIELKKAAEINSDYILDIAMVYEMKNDIPNAIKYYELDIANLTKYNALKYYKDIAELKKKVGNLRKLK